MKPKVGDKITAVYRNIYNRHVILLRVTKVGRKYLHGMTQYFEPDGNLREGHEIKINLDISDIYTGLRNDLRDAEFKYRGDYQGWKNSKLKKQTDLEYELRNYVWAGLDKWEEENPMPQPPEFPLPS